jgi:hypothetical protein
LEASQAKFNCGQFVDRCAVRWWNIRNPVETDHDLSTIHRRSMPQDVVLACKWINLAAAHASGRQCHDYLRLRNTVPSKMSFGQILEGQRPALTRAPGGRPSANSAMTR